jgi:hypothetical protein
MRRVAITIPGRKWTSLAEEAVPRAEFALVNAHLALFAAGRERTKAYSILVRTSGLTMLRRLFTLYGATKIVASAIAGNPGRIP